MDHVVEGPASFGLIVNLAARTIEGFLDRPVKIIDANQATISFEGTDATMPEGRLIGYISRLTGEARVVYTKGPGLYSFELKCTPTERKF